MPEKPVRTWRWRARRWLIRVVVLYVVWCVGIYSMQTRMLFPTSMIGERVSLSLPRGGGVELVKVEGPASPVETLVMHPTAHASDGKPTPVVVMFHGNAELSQDYVGERLIEHLRARGITVVFPEYRGYGAMPGTPGQREIGEDMKAVADWLVKQPWCDRNRIVYFGWSLGGGVACQLASDRKPSAGLVLQSTFTSVASFAGRYLVPSFLVKHPFRNDQVLASLDTPVLVIHGTRDSVVPVAHGRKLSKIAKRGTYVELEADHFHDWADWGAYIGAIDRWLDERGM
ncbi:MAG: alpha/beta fold hydrolase [Phycisphaerales bacterium]